MPIGARLVTYEESGQAGFGIRGNTSPSDDSVHCSALIAPWWKCRPRVDTSSYFSTSNFLYKYHSTLKCWPLILFFLILSEGYLDVSLIKHIQDLYADNYKMLMRENKDLSK